MLNMPQIKHPNQHTAPLDLAAIRARLQTAQGSDHKDTFVLVIDKERLKNAPGFDHTNWPQMASREWVSNLYTYYDIAPYWTTPTASPMTSATVKSVDPTQKTITLQVDEQMLKNLQAGDSTQVTLRKHPVAK